MFSLEGSADDPVFPVQLDLSIAVDLEHPRTRLILPRRRVGIVTPRARSPVAGRGLQAQRLVRSQVVVFPAELIEPGLQVLRRGTAALHGALQLAMKALHFPLGLRVTDSAMRS